MGQRFGRFSPLTITLLVVMIGFFQSFVLLHISIGIGCVLLDGHESRTQQTNRLRSLPYFIGYGALAILLHRLAFKFFLLIKDLEPAHLDQYMRNTLGMLRLKPLEYLFGHVTQIIRSYLHPSYSYGPGLWALPILILGSLLTYCLAKSSTKTCLHSSEEAWLCCCFFHRFC